MWVKIPLRPACCGVTVMKHKPGVATAFGLAFGALLLIPATALYGEQGNKKPSLSLKATPAVSFAPARIVVVAEVKGGANDFEEFYCPSVEWEWGDLTRSEERRVGKECSSRLSLCR